MNRNNTVSSRVGLSGGGFVSSMVLSSSTSCLDKSLLYSYDTLVEECPSYRRPDNLYITCLICIMCITCIILVTVV